MKRTPMTIKKSDHITIVGAGMAGTLLAILLARRGFHVDLFEQQPDPRSGEGCIQLCSNLALGERADALGIRVERHPRSELDRLSDGQRHQDVVAEFEPANLHGEKELDRLLDYLVQATAEPAGPETPLSGPQ